VSVKRNVIANYLGQGWSALMGLAFIPLYIHLMGAESYGLVGFAISMQAIVYLFDIGLSQGLNREAARLSALPDSAVQLVNTVKTLEIIYWGMALLVLLVLFTASPFIANHWLNAEKITKHELISTLQIMAVLIAIRWPISLYTGGLNGLQQQIGLNLLNAVFAALQGIGALLVLSFIAPTIQAFLIWQLMVTFAQVVMMRWLLWQGLPEGGKAVFSLDVLRGMWRFTSGVMGIALTSILLMQTDKIVLSKLLTLTEFGYYTFAATVASVIVKFSTPIFTAFYPKITRLVAINSHAELIDTYHRGCQLVSVAVIPIALILAFFSREILEVWTQNTVLSSKASSIVAMLVLGNALNGLMTIPYVLQLAYGWTRLMFFTNCILVVLAVPLFYVTALKWGGAGVAAVWVMINASYVVFSLNLIHRRLLVGEKWRWYFEDVGKIMLGPLLIVVTCKLILDATKWGQLQDTVAILVTGAVAVYVAISSANRIPFKFRIKAFQ